MLSLDLQQGLLVAPSGNLTVCPDDEVNSKLAMLIAGECLGLGPTAAAAAFSYGK